MKALAKVFTLPTFLLLCHLGTGCFVITGERRIRPDSPGDIVRKGTSSEDELVFYRVQETPELKLEVGFVNYYVPPRWEVVFIFNVLPFYLNEPDKSPWHLYAELSLEPKLSGVTFDPNQVFLIQTNRKPSQLVDVWKDDANRTNSTTREHVWSSKGAPLTLLITNRTLLSLNFPDRDHGFLNSPFQLSIEGLQVSGRPIFLPPTTYKYTVAIHPGIRIH
jgi:hypothetical protein